MARKQQPDLRLKPLTRKQREAVQLVVAGYREKEVAAQLQISGATFWRWKQLPMWQVAINEGCRAQMEEAEVEVKSLTGLATKSLRTLVCTGSDQVKLGAARLIYETVDRLVAREQQQQVVIELEEQLEELKALVATQQNQLPAATDPVIEAEIRPVANKSANATPDLQLESQ